MANAKTIKKKITKAPIKEYVEPEVKYDILNDSDEGLRKEYLRTKNLLLFQGDVLDSQYFDKEFIDLIVTSPPYNVGIEYNSNDDTLSYQNYLEFSEKWMSKIEEGFNKYGVWAIVIDAFTPIPYKALTLGSGLMKFNPILFACVSFPVRSIRYILVANTASFIGIHLREQFEKTILIIVLFVSVIIGAVFYFKNRVAKVEKSADKTSLV